MGSGIDIQLVRDYYRGLSDDELVRVLTADAKGLTAGALEVVKEEIMRRGLQSTIYAAVHAQQEPDEIPMKAFDPEGCPVEETGRLWLEHSFLYLLELFGRTETARRTVLVPDRSHFPVRYDGSEQSAYETLKIVARQMELAPENIRLDFYDERLRNITAGTPGGIYWGGRENDSFEISLAREMLKYPEHMVAILAHEIAHIKLLGENRMDRNDEKITDLTTIFFGLGIFCANEALRTFNHGWSSSGYLTQMEWGYALALFAALRKETEPGWLKHVSTNVRADFLQSQRFMVNNGIDIF